MKKNNPFLVPEDYFEQASAEIWSQIDSGNEPFFTQQKAEIIRQTIHHSKVVSIRKIVLATASAAAVLLAGLFFFKDNVSYTDPSFSELISTVELDETAILLEVTEDQFIEFVGEDLVLLADEKKENNSSKRIKPTRNIQSPNFEAVNEEEIMEYLLQENYLEIEID